MHRLGYHMLWPSIWFDQYHKAPWPIENSQYVCLPKAPAMCALVLLMVTTKSQASIKAATACSAASFARRCLFGSSAARACGFDKAFQISSTKFMCLAQILHSVQCSFTTVQLHDWLCAVRQSLQLNPLAAWVIVPGAFVLHLRQSLHVLLWLWCQLVSQL